MGRALPARLAARRDVDVETQATPRPWAYCQYGDFENESYIETWFAIVPQGQEPEDKYSEIQFEIARVGVAFWRHGISHREVAPEEDEANAALIVRAVNNHGALVEALGWMLGQFGGNGSNSTKREAIRLARAALDTAREA